MVFALVHFTVGFVIVLTVLSVVPITRYRLTGAYAGGAWALGPDVHHLVDGALGDRIHALHDSRLAELFFFHSTLDGELYRAHALELTFVSLVALGTAFLVYELRFDVIHSSTRRLDTSDLSDESP